MTDSPPKPTMRKISINIHDREKWKAFKIRCTEKNTTATDRINHHIKNDIKRWKQKMEER